MNLSILLRNPFKKMLTTTSPAQFLFGSAPLMILVLAVLVVAFQLNQQLYDQQQIISGRVARTASRQVAQLQREHLRLYAMIEGARAVVDTTAFQLQMDLVNSRIKIMQNIIVAGDTSREMYNLYNAYDESWQALQPQLIAWQSAPNNARLKEEVTTSMVEIELDINHMSTLIQLAFEDQMASWADKSQFLNRLLILGSISFTIIILLVAYASYLFVKNQSMSEQTLRNSEQRLRAILDAIPDAVYRVNRDGVYTDYKPPTHEGFRPPQNTFAGKSIRDLLPADVALLIHNGIQSVLSSGEQQLLEFVLPDLPSGESQYYEARLLPSGKDEVQILVRDITTVKQEEEAALQAQKLESLGVLAGGIAHDFNNLLTGMLGQASLAAAKLARNLPAGEHIGKVILSAERAADLTRQLLAYTGKGKFQVGPLDLNQLIRDTTGLMETILPNNATLVLTLHDTLPLVQSDRSQIQQVIMNLFINAIEALPEGKGSIEIVTDTRQVEGDLLISSSAVNSHASSGELAPGKYVLISVTDDGVGMDQATLSRIFDPFFSTKPKGHGLGLSATIGIIRTHQGAILVQSQPNVGTSFTLLLPALAAIPLPGDEDAKSMPVAMMETPKSVLIIDDEASVREVATDILAEQGYRVIAAASGAEGIDLFRTNCQDVGVVLLDLKMPGMNGKETFHELKKIQPELKIIFTSGYSEAEVSTLTQEFDRITFLSKPYTVKTLTNQIYQMLSL